MFPARFSKSLIASLAALPLLAVALVLVASPGQAQAGGQFSIADVTVNEGAGTATFVVSYTAGTAANIDYVTASGTATSGADFTGDANTLVFPTAAATQTQNIVITIGEDALDEAAETFTVTLSNPTGGATITDATATGTITDNDAAPTVGFAAAASSGTEAATSVALTVQLSAASGQAVTVNYAAAAGTAATPADFSLASSTLTFTAGQVSQDITVTVANDVTDEDDETFTVTLSGPTNAGLATATHTYTINDNDAAPTLGFASGSSSASEGNSGTSTANLPVSLAAASGKTVTVDYAVTGGSATGSGTDFTLAAGTLTFVAGDTSENVVVSVVGDTLDEDAETVQVTLSAPSNAALGTSAHTFTINDDDAAPAVGFAAATGSGSEATSPSIAVALGVPSGKTVTVDYSVAAGTATAGADFTLASGTLTFAPGDTSETVSVTVANDATNEPDETFTVTVSSPTNAVLGTATHTYTILDNDGPPTVGFAAPTSSGAESVAAANLPVALSAASGQAVTVDYAVTGGSASGSDFVLASGTLTFAPGETTADVPLAITADALSEASETVEVTLSSPTVATLGATTVHTYTITDDDPLPTVSFGASASSGSEGTATVNLAVSLSTASGQAVTVPFAYSGTAGGADYTATASPLTFTAGTTSQTITLSVIDDSAGEGPETVIVTLGTPTGATVGATGVHTYTITDNDAAPATAHTEELSASAFNGGTGTWQNQDDSFSATDAFVSDDAYTRNANSARSLRVALSDVPTAQAGATVTSVKVRLEQHVTGFTDDAWTLRAYLGTGTTLIGGPVDRTGTLADGVLEWDVTGLRSWTIADLDNLEFRATTKQVGAAKDGTWYADRLWVEVGLNLPPAASAGSLTVAEDATASGSLVGSDPNADGLTFTVVANGAKGTATVTDAATGAFTYTATDQVGGADSFTFRVTDAGGLQSSTATVSVTITAVNDAPVAGDDELTVVEDAGATLDVRLDDTDVDGSLAAAIPTITAEPALGIVDVDGTTGIVTYTANPDETGADAFDYQVCDGGSPSLCDQGTVEVTITNLNDAPSLDPVGDRTTAEETVLSFTLTATDVDASDPRTFSLTPASGAWGTASVNPLTGVLTFTPATDFVGTQAFTATVTDSSAAADSETFNIGVTNVNDAPVLGAIGSRTTAEDTPLAFAVGATDVDAGDSATYSTTQPASGTAAVNAATGAFTFTPTPNFVGMVSVTVTVADAGALTDSETFSIAVTAVNDAPVLAAIGSRTTAEDTPLAFTVAASDVDAGAALTYSITSAPATGTATVGAATGAFSFTPAANLASTVNVEVTVSDGTATDSETFAITVTAVNDAPDAVDDLAGTTEDAFVDVDVRANDVDVDDTVGDMAPSILDTPAAGSVAVNGDGTIRYTPDLDSSGADAFTYEICDLASECDTAMVTVNVAAANDAPQFTLVPAPASTPEETAVAFTVEFEDVDGDALALSSASPVGGAVTTDSGTGDVTFTPAADFAGTATFDLVVSDGNGGTDTQGVSITVSNVNDAPVLAAVGDRAATEDAAFAVTFSAADADAGDTVAFSTSALPAWLSLAGATLSGTPANADVGVVTVTVTATDGASATDAETFAITVSNVNDAPTISALADLATDEDTPTSALAFTVGDAETAAGSLTVTASSSNTALAPNGNLALAGTGASRTLTVTPAADQSGTATITVTVSDGTLSESEAFVLTVNAVNDAPVANAGDDQAVDEMAAVALDGSFSEDVEGDALAFAWTQVDASGFTVTLTGADTDAPTFTAPTLAANTVVELIFELSVTATGGSSTDQVSVSVINVNGPPVVSAGADFAVDEGAAVTLTATASDPDGDSMSLLWQRTGGTGAAITLADPTTLSATFTAPAVATNSPVTLVFQFSASDAFDPATTVTDSVTVTVNNVNAAPVASAGVDASAVEATMVSLSGTGSSDPDGDALTYAWTQVAGPAVTLSDATAAAPTFTAPTLSTNAPAILGFSLVVTDDQTPGLPSAADLVNVTVTNVNGAPTANAGTDQSVDEAVTVTLSSAGSADPDSDPLAFAWTQTDASGYTVTLSDATAAAPTFTAPTLPSNVPAVLTFSLVATDNQSPALSSAADSVTVTVGNLNAAPTASAGTDLTVDEQAVGVALSGSATDPDGDALTYAWTQTDTSGYTVTLSDATAAAPTFTAPTLPTNTPATLTFSLVATDSEGASSAADTVNVVVQSTNRVPVADAGADLSVLEGASVALAGSASDLDGDTLAYAWTQTDTSGYTVTLTGPTTLAPSFTAPTLPTNAAATLAFQLEVDDGNGVTGTDSVLVVVGNVNQVPAVTAIAAQTVAEDALLALTAMASDGDSDTLAWSIETQPSNGVASINAATGEVSYDPAQDFNGADSFVVKATDGQGGEDTETVAVTVTPVNDAPVLATIPAQATGEDTALAAFTVSATDVDGDTIAYSIQTAATSGTAGVTGSSVSYTPNADFNGADSFVVRASDGTVWDEQAVDVTVAAVNDAPSFTGGADQTVAEDSCAPCTVAGWASAIGTGPADEAAQTVGFTVTVPAESAALFASPPAIDATGQLSYTLAAHRNTANVAGPVTLTVVATDSGSPAASSAEDTFTLTVTSANDAPSYTKGANQSSTACNGVTAQPWATAMSPGPFEASEGQTTTFLVSNNKPSMFSVQPTLNAAGELTYQLSCSPGAPGTYAIVAVRIRDSLGLVSAAQTFRVTVA